jgi:murein DD-endopeptidase MepM/ murein hydrolase activator NlpD
MKKGHSRRGRIALSVLLMLLLMISSAAASDIETKMKELEDLNDTLEKYEQRFNDKKKEANQVLVQIDDLEGNMTALEKEIRELEGQIQQTQDEISVLEQDIAVSTEHLNQRAEYLNKRLVQIYQQGDVSYLEVIFQATSFADFLTRFDLIEKIAEKDIALLHEIHDQRALLFDQKAELEAKSQQLTAMKDQTQSKHQQMELQSEQKRNLLNSIEDEKAAYLKAMDELEASQQELEELIRELQSRNKAAYMDSGTMAWPVPGYYDISSPYGMRKHPIFGDTRLHTGIDIPAPKGTLAAASAKGMVIFAGTKTGYGNCVILDHGGGVSTQYAHLSKITVNTGALVDKGGKIGEVGSTGWSTGNHLHFGILIDGNTVNPIEGTPDGSPLYYVKKP